jgi:hypothetical protein
LWCYINLILRALFGCASAIRASMYLSPNVMSIFVNFVIVLYDKISPDRPDKPEAFGKIVRFMIKYCLNQNMRRSRVFLGLIKHALRMF